MARPGGRPRAIREPTVHDLRDEFLARCRAKNLTDRTMEWYEDRTLQLCDLWATRGRILEDCRAALDDFVSEDGRTEIPIEGPVVAAVKR